ncbi:ABC transporter substrate-binding protein [Streptomyces sp. NPDC058872]|uniref:ABC transporter substrate-binding protein n=1 Tax=Streptomyces sp. NPDC058872 TaxID=3346661 RepID=UPI0036BAE2F4
MKPTLSGKPALLLMATALALTACSGPSDSNGSATKPSGRTAAKLTIGQSLAPQSLSASAPVTGGQTLFYQPVYDSLLVLGPDGSPQPGLATKWAYDPTGTKLTLTLRAGVKFTNGETFDAAAAKANLDRNIKAGTNAKTLQAVTGITVKDPRTLVLSLKQKDPGILSALGTSAAYMEAPKTFGGADEGTKPVGTGPYTLDPSTVIGSAYVYKKNPDYWNASAVRYDQVDIKVFADPSAMVNAIRTGQVNAASANGTTGEQAKQSGWKVTTQQLDIAGLFLFDREGKSAPALADKRVRQAINLSFDRKALLKAVAQGQGTVTSQMFAGPDGGPLDPSLETKWAYDPAKAKRLLAEAGHASDVKITLPTLPGAGPLLQTIKQQLAAVGITAELADGGPNVLTDLLTAKYPASYFQFQAGDPWLMIQLLLQPDSQFNPFHVSDPKLANLIDEYRNGDDTSRKDTLVKLNARLTDEAWFAPWYRMNNAWATDPRTSVTLLKGWASPNLLGFAPAS